MSPIHTALTRAHVTWQPILEACIQTLSPAYIENLSKQPWLPGFEMLFNAFSIALTDTHYILLGESPYPREASANGYAFWDAAVSGIWSETGLSTPTNRATSLRNFIKMLLVTNGMLGDDRSQPSIASLNKESLIHDLPTLFENMLAEGFLLLNASLVLSDKQPAIDARAWLPFMEILLKHIAIARPSCRLLLFGNIAKKLEPIVPANLARLTAEHPYNVSFIDNQDVQTFFRPLHLLRRRT